jgi:agmatine/peptidylarginine deiminase
MKFASTTLLTATVLFAAGSSRADDGEMVPAPRVRPTHVIPTADEIANPDLYHPQYDYAVYLPPPSLGPPPENPVTRPGEFEEMDATLLALVNYGGAYHQMWADMVEAFAEGGHTVIIAQPGMQENVEWLIAGNEVDESMYSWLNYPIDSIWIRDYGPEFAVEDDGTRHVIDAAYHPDRPKDDAIPSWIAAADWVGSEVPLEVHSHEHRINGGNIMTDGAGTCFFSNIIYGYEKPSGWTDDDVDTLMADYYGCEQLIVLNPICLDGTGHIDLYAKVMGPNSILLGEYPPDTHFHGEEAVSDPWNCTDPMIDDYQDQEDNLAIIEATANTASEPWVVTRLHMLEPYTSSYGWVYRSYMNSEVFNGAVAMPSYYDESGPETADDLLDYEAWAIEAYETAAPGVVVFPIDADHIIPLAGAMHCIAHEIPPDPSGDWTMPAEFCGDGIVNGDEECDGPAMDDQECTDFDYESGDLACGLGCEFDFSDCAPGGDTDVDSDSDSDSDADADSDAGPTGGGGDDDCGCRATGHRAEPSLLQLLLSR